MTTREKAVDLGSQRASAIVIELGHEIRRARTNHGLSQAEVARAARTSRAQVSRIERGRVPKASVSELARLLAVVGLELSARAYPAGKPVWDAAHRALLDRFRAVAPHSVQWRFEVPLNGTGDGRAWDAVLGLGGANVAVEAETRPRDIQTLQRRLAMKMRDDPDVAAVILLLSATRHNRILLREHGEALRVALPVRGEAVLAALAAGRHPGGSGIVLL